jgi:cytochrome c2
MTQSLKVSALATLDMKVYRGYVPRPRNDGGAVVPVGTGFLLVDGDGRFSQLAWNDADDVLTATGLTLHAPVNFNEFRSNAPPGEFVDGAFRVADLVAQDLGDRLRLVTSHHYWKRSEGCWVARLSETTIAKADIAAAGEGSWRTLFESQPCLQLNRVIKAGPFLQMGGSMALFDATHVLLGLGDHAFDGINAQPAAPQDPGADYGKTLLIDLDSGEKQIFSIGHRNSHGAVMTAAGTVWMTEMGPQGGDELNRIQRAMNYGWPNVTFGTQYGGAMWPPSTTPGRHTGFQPPVHAWVPSLAPTGLIEVGPHTVPLWQGDLLITTLRGRSLQRIRLEGDRVVYVETIETGRRMRDIAEGSNGRIIVWTDTGELISIRKAATSEGERLFGLCASCHEIGNGTRHGAGPDLADVIGRGVATAPGFDFSQALKNPGGQWTEERLAAFLRDPQAFASGTTMPSVAFSNPAEISSLIAYLRNR